MQDAMTLSTTEDPANPANGEVSVDHERLDRLKYATGLLGTQQGLNTALFGAFPFFSEVHVRWPRGWAALAWLAGMVIFGAAWRSWIPKYYQKRFGQVEPREMSAKQFAILFMVLIALFSFGQPVARYLDPMFSGVTTRLHLAISDPSHEINLGPSLLWMALFLIGLRWPPRRMNGERLCFALFGLLAFLSIALFPVWHPDAGKLEVWRVLNAGGLGLTLIIQGFYDHIVLVRALPKRVAEGDDE